MRYGTHSPSPLLDQQVRQLDPPTVVVDRLDAPKVTDQERPCAVTERTRLTGRRLRTITSATYCKGW
jgi:hypothetical protein